MLPTDRMTLINTRSQGMHVCDRSCGGVGPTRRRHGPNASSRWDTCWCPFQEGPQHTTAYVRSLSPALPIIAALHACRCSATRTSCSSRWCCAMLPPQRYLRHPQPILAPCMCSTGGDSDSCCLFRRCPSSWTGWRTLSRPCSSPSLSSSYLVRSDTAAVSESAHTLQYIPGWTMRLQCPCLSGRLCAVNMQSCMSSASAGAYSVSSGMQCRRDHTAGGVQPLRAAGGRIQRLVRARAHGAVRGHRLAHQQDPGRAAGPRPAGDRTCAHMHLMQPHACSKGQLHTLDRPCCMQCWAMSST